MTYKYQVRRSRGSSWAVDRLHLIGEHHHTRENTRYFPTKEEADAFKSRKETEE